jgi:SHS2 domain-containing protein
MREASWEHFEHGADIGVRGYGDSLAEAFRQAALALTGVITDPAGVNPVEPVAIECEAPDNELLFADWLNAIIYEMAVHKMFFSRFDIDIKDHHLQASIWGEQVNIEKHQPVVEVKGATYTALQVTQDAAGMWTVQCVVDV